MSENNSVIPGLKVILHNASRVNNPDDPSLPYKLEASFRPPEFMQMTFILLVGSQEQIVIRSETREAMMQFVEGNQFATHPRLIKLTVTGPEGEILSLPEKKQP